MVVRGDTRLTQADGFLRAEFPEGHTDLHTQGGDVLDDVQHLLEALGAATDTAPGGTHAETGGACLTGGTRAFHDLFFLHQPLDLDAGVVARGLRAVGAVLGTAAGLDGEECAELHFGIGPVRLMDFPGTLDEFEEGEIVKGLEFGENHLGE